MITCVCALVSTELHCSDSNGSHLCSGSAKGEAPLAVQKPSQEARHRSCVEGPPSHGEAFGPTLIGGEGGAGIDRRQAPSRSGVCLMPRRIPTLVLTLTLTLTLIRNKCRPSWDFMPRRRRPAND